jgi:hypothetical protein
MIASTAAEHASAQSSFRRRLPRMKQTGAAEQDEQPEIEYET